MQQRHRLSFGVLALILASAPAAWAQALNSATTSVSLNAPLAESVSVSASPGTVSFTLVSNGPASGSSAVTITTTWVLKPSRTTITTYAYFSSSTAALTDGSAPPNNIPSSSVKGSVNGGASTPFTGTSPFAVGSSLTVSTVAITGANRNSSAADTLALTIDTTGLALPAGTYTGTLVIQAQAL